MDPRQQEPKSQRLFNFIRGEYRSYQSDRAYYGVKDVPSDLQALSDEDVLNFCVLCCTEGTHHNLTGLWFACWAHREGKSFLVERIAELPDADFHKIDFNVRYTDKSNVSEWIGETCFGELLSLIVGRHRYISGETSSKLLRKLLELPQDKIKQLSFAGGSTDSHLNVQRFSLFLHLCLLRPKEKLDNDEWHHQFVYFISNLELNTSEADLNNLEEWFKRREGSISWYISFYRQLNHLKQYEQSLRENPVVFETVLATIQKEVENSSKLPAYPKIFIFMWLVKLIDAYKNFSQSMPALRNQLLEQITFADCKNWRAKEIFYESRQMLADEYFVQPCSTLKQKLINLKMALYCTLQVWLQQPSTSTQLVLNIAMAFLLVNQKNLNRIPGFAEQTPMLMWLKDDMQEIADQLPKILPYGEQEKFITHVLDDLITQRNLVMPILDELDRVRSELVSERKDKLKLKSQLDTQNESLRLLSDQVAVLVTTVAKMQGEKVQESKTIQETLTPVSSSFTIFR